MWCFLLSAGCRGSHRHCLKFDLLTAYVDELSAPYLEDAEIDFVTDQLGSQLTLKAPNAKMRKVQTMHR